MSRLLDFIIGNFWLRNLLVFSFFTSLFLYYGAGGTWTSKLQTGMAFLSLYTWITIHNRYVFERLLLRKKVAAYAGALTIGFIAYAAMLRVIMPDLDFQWQKLWKEGYLFAFNTIVGLFCYFTLRFIHEKQAFIQNKRYMWEMEQTYLRNQLNPHFLFNALNNIYSYSLVASAKTPELILKLSELMRYLIQFNKKNEILLREEIAFIENYLAFEKERLEDRCKIDYRKSLTDDTIAIQPLLFFPLVENAFKHGTNTMGNCFVNLNIRQSEGQMEVSIENKVLSHNKPSTHSGIPIVKKRLQLLYPDKHVLSLVHDREKFVARLTLMLA